jgi:hypothetical protein
LFSFGSKSVGLLFSISELSFIRAEQTLAPNAAHQAIPGQQNQFDYKPISQARQLQKIGRQAFTCMCLLGGSLRITINTA